MTDLPGGVGGVDRGDNATGVGSAVKEQRIFRNIWCHQSQCGPGTKSLCGQTTSQRLDTCAQLGEGHLASGRTVDDRWFVR